MMWLYEAAQRSQLFHSKRPEAGGGVYGGQAGPTAAGWVWDGAMSDYATNPVFLPLTLDDPIYEKATPRAGMIDPATNRVDLNGRYVISARERFPAGTTVRALTGAGSGWGDPFERDSERVKNDVRDGYVTIEGAARDYGVVVVGDADHDPEVS